MCKDPLFFFLLFFLCCFEFMNHCLRSLRCYYVPFLLCLQLLYAAVRYNFIYNGIQSLQPVRTWTEVVGDERLQEFSLRLFQLPLSSLVDMWTIFQSTRPKQAWERKKKKEKKKKKRKKGKRDPQRIPEKNRHYHELYHLNHWISSSLLISICLPKTHPMGNIKWALKLTCIFFFFFFFWNNRHEIKDMIDGRQSRIIYASS